MAEPYCFDGTSLHLPMAKSHESMAQLHLPLAEPYVPLETPTVGITWSAGNLGLCAQCFCIWKDFNAFRNSHK